MASRGLLSKIQHSTTPTTHPATGPDLSLTSTNNNSKSIKGLTSYRC